MDGMRYLLDTCVICETMKPVPDENVLAWFSSVDDRELFLSTVVLGEVLKGILLLPMSRRRTAFENWFRESVELSFVGRVLSFDSQVAKVWAERCAIAELNGHPRAVADSMIAATALRYGMTLVTRNVKDMDYMGVELLNPFEFQTNERK